MSVMKTFFAGLAAIFLFAAAVPAQELVRYPFPRTGAVCLKLDLPLFPEPKERKLSYITALPHYAGSDKSIAAEPRAIQAIAHLGYFGLAVAGAFTNPAFLIIAAYHAAGLVKQAKTRKKAPKQPGDFNFIWSH